MKVSASYLVLAVIIIFMVSLYNHLAQLSCLGIKCLQYTPEGRILIVLSVMILTIINRYLGVIAAGLFMYNFNMYSTDNDMVTDKYNCKVIDNIDMDNALKDRRDEKQKTGDKKLIPFCGNFHSTPSCLLNSITDKIPPLNMNTMVNVNF